MKVKTWGYLVAIEDVDRLDPQDIKDAILRAWDVKGIDVECMGEITIEKELDDDHV